MNDMDSGIEMRRKSKPPTNDRNNAQDGRHGHSKDSKAVKSVLPSRNQSQASAARVPWAEGRKVGDQVREEIKRHVT